MIAVINTFERPVVISLVPLASPPVKFLSNVMGHPTKRSRQWGGIKYAVTFNSER
jgi:hypothetical protein